jgi:hypothetical protein
MEVTKVLDKCMGLLAQSHTNIRISGRTQSLYFLIGISGDSDKQPDYGILGLVS